jgi:hypothetical protein
MTATRRLWARRAARAGWLIAPILAAPVKFYTWFKESIFGITLTTVLLGPLIGAVVWQRYLDTVATAETIVAEMKADTCVKNTLTGWKTSLRRPITNRDIVKLKSECEERAIDHELKNAQREAISAGM